MSTQCSVCFPLTVDMCLYHSKLLFDPVEETTGYEPLPEERPGGFNWGEQQQQEQAAAAAADAPQDNDDPH